jgi:hypothetical protein
MAPREWIERRRKPVFITFNPLEVHADHSPHLELAIAGRVNQLAVLLNEKVNAISLKLLIGEWVR